MAGRAVGAAADACDMVDGTYCICRASERTLKNPCDHGADAGRYGPRRATVAVMHVRRKLTSRPH